MSQFTNPKDFCCICKKSFRHAEDQLLQDTTTGYAAHPDCLKQMCRTQPANPISQGMGYLVGMDDDDDGSGNGGLG